MLSLQCHLGTPVAHGWFNFLRGSQGEVVQHRTRWSPSFFMAHRTLTRDLYLKLRQPMEKLLVSFPEHQDQAWVELNSFLAYIDKKIGKIQNYVNSTTPQLRLMITTAWNHFFTNFFLIKELMVSGLILWLMILNT